MKILILGGTAEARQLADRLVDAGHEVITSLAGRTSGPMLPAGSVRIGSFGGIAGLVAYLHIAGIERLVDATHPYAEQMSANAVAAAQSSGVPLVRYMRPAWVQPMDAHWQIVGTPAEAAASLPANAVALLTTGHAGLDIFLARDDCHFVVRVIEPPEFEVPRHARLLLSRPPYSLNDEMALMEREGITHLVTKNSGGGQTAAKLEAAQRLGVTVVMIARPSYGPAREVADIDAAIAALEVGA
ncbi:hypothetical protein VW29_06535 [Devosia limi DSM 17137]|uniref:Precorrin-6A/cobalt-precorrin-6A reductase n=1 Tax=Devosia limi DSM 17137 TaxID=1121477 RepID=A0A0F5LTC6_9HYPH|nr:cobalt-precorrin-6A reductase [Devosia limi]KKB85625.1 hypothetical protein VW29_06535 [Devosia limi DSM 17137]SHF90583.1 precorrin-6A/cobalt-precorrin-6A reductase [Devosia limi DSM 17137]